MLGKIMKKTTAAARVAEIAAKLDEARRNLTAMEGAKASASAAAETALAALDAAALAVARRAFEIADADHRDAIALFDAASAALDAAEEEAATERWRADAAAYRDDVTAFERSTRADLSTMGEIARRIVSTSVDLEARRRDLDGRMPAGEAAVPPPEGWRAVPGRPEETIGEEVVDSWCFASNGNYVGDAAEACVQGNGPHGYLPVTGGGGAWQPSQSTPVMKRKIRRRTVLARVDPIWAVPLASALAVPGATAVDRPGWKPTESPAAALEALSVPASPQARPQRVDISVLD